MSSAKKGRKIQSNSGRSFQSQGRIGAAAFADTIAKALRHDYGRATAARKSLARLTGTNERAVKNWFEARNGPSAECLVLLCRHSDRVLETVLELAGRKALIQAKVMTDAKEKLRETLAFLDGLEKQQN